MSKKYLSLLIMMLVLVSLSYSCSGPSAPAQPSAPAATANKTTVEETPAVVLPTVPKGSQPVIQFSITPASIKPGGSASLSWTVTNATSVTIDHGIGNVPMTGTHTVSPTAPTTYKITASNASGGSAIKTVSLIVTSSAPAAQTTPPKTTK